MKNILAIQSHVVFGHAGNSAAEFPMRRLGANVWPLNTVQFSNHTQYGKWTGCVMPPSHLTEIVQGIADIGQLAHCDARRHDTTLFRMPHHGIAEIFCLRICCFNLAH
ncbi:hypothetical protein ACH57_26175, partial [Salmonella enterica subsp. enterica serovar Typhimurium]